MVEFILASASPRRRQILENLGIDFKTVRAPDIEEDTQLNNPDLKPSEIAISLAEKKSLALSLDENQLALTADTVVAINSITLGKPKDNGEAVDFLKKLSGKKHEVITAVAIRRGSDKPITAHESTNVFFSPMTDRDIEWYVSTGEPFGKAGGYAIQGACGIFINRIEGCYFNVVGLPVYRLMWLLSQAGYDYQDFFKAKE